MENTFDNQTLMFMIDCVMDKICVKEQENIVISNDIFELSKTNFCINNKNDLNNLKTLKWNNMKYINIGKNLISCIQEKIVNPHMDEHDIFRYVIKLEELDM